MSNKISDVRLASKVGHQFSKQNRTPEGSLSWCSDVLRPRLAVWH